MARITRRLLIVFACVALLTALASVLLLHDSSPALPNPNGYDDFVKAGRMVIQPLDSEGHYADYRELSLQELQIAAATNAEVLKIVRGALEKQCRVPVQNSADWFRAHLREKSTFWNLTSPDIS